MEADHPTIDILYEDDNLLAVNKPEGLSTIPERLQGRDNLILRLTGQVGGRLFVVHRLDKGVSGVVLVARNAATHKLLNDQFSNRSVRKDYLALVLGRVEQPDGVIEKPIRQFGSGRMGVDIRRGKPSVTAFRVLDRHEDLSLLRVFPHTGRRHQVRVHLYSIDHPVAGDDLYGDSRVQKRFSRLMLHAWSIAVIIPGGKELAIEAPLPLSFRADIAREGFTLL